MRYRVSLTRPTAENKDVTVDARNEDEAIALVLRLENMGALAEEWEPADWCGGTTVELVEEVEPQEDIPPLPAAHLLARLQIFETECGEAQFTDTGDAWDLLHATQTFLAELITEKG